MIKPELLVSPYVGLDSYLNASPVCDEIYEELLDVTGMDRAKVVRAFQMAWWACALTYMFPHPEFLLNDIRKEIEFDPTLCRVDMVEEVVTILLLNQPNLNCYQRKFLKRWSYFYDADFYSKCSETTPFYALFQKYSKQENQGKNGIFFLNFYRDDGTVLRQICEEKLTFSSDENVALIKLMHRLGTKQIMNELVSSWEDYERTLNHFDIYADKFGIVGQNVFNFYLPDEEIMRDLDRWVGNTKDMDDFRASGLFPDKELAAIRRELSIIKSWEEAPVENQQATPDNLPSERKDEEIEQLRQTITRLESEIATQQDASASEALNPDSLNITCGSYKLKAGRKTDFIKVLYILHELGFFEKLDGSEVTNRNELINAFLDKNSNVSKLLKSALGTDSFMTVFSDIQEKAAQIYGDFYG